MKFAYGQILKLFKIAFNRESGETFYAHVVAQNLDDALQSFRYFYANDDPTPVAKAVVTITPDEMDLLFMLPHTISVIDR